MWRPTQAKRSRCLTDGRNYLWVYLTEDGFVGCLSRYGANAPGKILAAISEAFETDVFSEYEPQYWGFDTQEEWDAALKKISDQARDQFYADVCAYIRGEPNDIKPGTIGEIKAKIAKTLVESEAALLSRKTRTGCCPRWTPSMTATTPWSSRSARRTSLWRRCWPRMKTTFRKPDQRLANR